MAWEGVPVALAHDQGDLDWRQKKYLFCLLQRQSSRNILGNAEYRFVQRAIKWGMLNCCLLLFLLQLYLLGGTEFAHLRISGHLGIARSLLLRFCSQAGIYTVTEQPLGVVVEI